MFVVNFVYFLDSCRGYRLGDILKYFSEDLSFNEKAMYLQTHKLFPSHFKTLQFYYRSINIVS